MNTKQLQLEVQQPHLSRQTNKTIVTQAAPIRERVWSFSINYNTRWWAILQIIYKKWWREKSLWIQTGKTYDKGKRMKWSKPIWNIKKNAFLF